MALVVEVVEREAVEHVAKVGEWVKVVSSYALDAWVVLGGEAAVFELASLVNCELEASLAFKTCAYV